MLYSFEKMLVLSTAALFCCSVHLFLVLSCYFGNNARRERLRHARSEASNPTEPERGGIATS